MTDLTAEPSPAAPALRRVAIDPLSRVEGHGKVTLLLDEHDRVRQARLHIVEFRGFERFIVGRPYWEVPVMVQRLCGICPVSHHLAACKAIEVALGIAAVPRSADRLRRLMHYAQIMQSHALHFFHLSSPDLLLGFDAPAARRNLAGVASEHPEVARRGVLLRRFGQEVIRMTSGKRVHGTGSVPGGVNRHLEPTDRDALRAQVPQMIDWCEDAVALAERLLAQDEDTVRRFGTMRSSWMSIVRPDGAMELYDGVLRVRDADGRTLLDGADVQGYLGLIEEAVEPWTYMKFPYLRALGRETGWYRVGPLARLQTCDVVPTPRAEAQRRRFVAAGPVHATLAYHLARMIEMLHATETLADLLEDDALVAGERTIEPPRPRPSRRSGVGVIEAPRGTLIHHYEIGDDDLVSDCNLIVSTTHNNHAMNESVRAVAADAFDGRALTPALLDRIEVAVRAYDPCLSCATHALGSMPLEVRVVDARGELRDAILRYDDGRLERCAT